MNPPAHVHVIPVDASLSAEEAWKELCIFGYRLTNTGSETWATIECDGEECANIEGAPIAEIIEVDPRYPE